MPTPPHTIKTFSPLRRATIDLLQAASRKHMVSGLIEVDITESHRRIRALKAGGGDPVTLTGFVIHCCARAVDRNKHMHAYRDWRNRLILFEEVDVSTTVEREVAGRKEVVAKIVRAANQKSAPGISRELRAAKEEPAEQAEVFRSIKLYLAIPAFLRRQVFRLLDKFPFLMKKRAGTIMVTSVGMFGRGASWGLPIASHTLNVTIGGIVVRPALVDDRLEEREHLCLTVTFDHDIVDGAPGAQFIQRFREMLEHGKGLKDEE